LLDQAIAFGAGKLNEVDVRHMLGAIDHNEVTHLLIALSQNNADQVVAVVQSLAEHSPNYDQVLADLLTALHHLALFQMAPEALDSSMPNYLDLKLLADNICPEDVQLYYQIGLIGRRDLPLAPDPKIGFEMVMLRMLAFKPEFDHNSTRTRTTPDNTKVDAPISTTPSAPSNTSTAPRSTPKQDENIQIAAISTPSVSSKTTVGELSDWEQLVEKLSLTGMAKQLALNCTLIEKDNERITLYINEAHQHLLSESRKKPIETALREVLQSNISLTIELTKTNLSETPAIKQQQRKQDRLDSAVSNIDSDHAVQQFKDVFDATVSSESIEPID
jgi:DNA polymerase-3 subunit gamma/tau